jgi:cytochrome P450
MYWDEDLDTWIITGMHEAKAALANGHLSSRWLRGGTPGARRMPVIEHVRDWLMWSDPPEHDIVRGQLSVFFTARTIAGHAPGVRIRVADAYAEFVRHGGGDVVEDFARPLVTRVIAEIIGLETIRPSTLQAWSGAAASLMARPHSQETVTGADCALRQLTAEMTGQSALERTVAERAGRAGKRAPGGDAARLASLFAFAGIETTTQALARLVDCYADGVFADGRAAEHVVAELLRFDTPVPQVPRVAASRTKISGHVVEDGQAVLVLLAAANRDPRVFADPSAVAPRTDAARHLAYGYGRHRCLGAPLANLILGCAAESLGRHPRPRRLGTAVWHRARGYRGIARLTVDYGPEETR